MANNKKIIWIGIASALLIGGGTFFWWKNKKAKEEEEKRRQEEEALKAEEEKKANAPRTIQYPSTPFTNSGEGNAFRAWVNKKYPTYAKQNDLSLSGDYNNSFIRKAYQQYGVEYIKEGKTTSKTSTSSGFKSGSLVYLKSDNSSIYSFPEFRGDYIIGSVDKTLTLDRPFAKYISNTGKGFLKVETIAFNPKCPPNAKCMPLFQAIKKTAYVPEKFVSNKPY
jgi:uncharacterized protein YxeA